MVNNLVSVITKELGIGIGEEFYLNDSPLAVYRFTEGGLEVRTPDSDEWQASIVSVNTFIRCKITLLPFNPQMGREYWTYWNNKFDICRETWMGHATDYARKASGVIFRTREEALNSRPAKYRELTGKEWK
mgnify:FL=1